MPTLFRLLFVVAVLVSIVYGGLLALATFGTPVPRQILTPIDLPKPQK